MKAEIFYKIDCHLGEGPLWDHRNAELLWVDVDNNSLYFLGNSNSNKEVHSFRKKIGFAAPAAHSNYIIGLEDGLYNYDRLTKKINLIINPESNIVNNRWNDGKCGPDGCIWGGTMSKRQELKKGSLYRLNQFKKLKKMYSPVSISNGLAWNTELGKMYYIDSPTRCIQTFDYKPGNDEIGQPSFKFELPAEMGYPDGMTIDEDGMLWVAHWDGHCIARWHPETGQLITKVDIPAPRVTSCTFGGQSMSRLYITTARKGLTEAQLQQFPDSGSIFIVDTNSKGLPADIFKSDG